MKSLHKHCISGGEVSGQVVLATTQSERPEEKINFWY